MTVDIKGVGKINASEDVLNLLSIVFQESSELFKIQSKNKDEQLKKNYEAVSTIRYKISMDIFYALEEIGYYD